MTTLVISDNGTDRPMTTEEIAAYQTTVAETQAAQAAAQEAAAAKEATRAAVLAKLGLTADEAAALLG